jgi:hypothetical protein
VFLGDFLVVVLFLDSEPEFLGMKDMVDIRVVLNILRRSILETVKVGFPLG